MMRTTATNRKLRELLLAMRDDKLVPQAPFQRRLVWTNKHKIALVQTVLEGYPFPEIFVAAGEVDPNTGEATELLVDGQQRISTLFQYFTASDLLKLPRAMPPFSTLSDNEKRAYLQYDVVVRDLGAVDNDTIVEVFTRINSTSYDLNAIELHNARYDGAFKKFGERVSEHQFFEKHRVFTATDIRRMNDLRFSLWVCITLLSSYFHRDEELESYLNQYNDSFPHAAELLNNLTTVFGFIDSCGFPDSCRCWKKADLFTLIVEIHQALFRDREPITPDQVAERLLPFYDQVDNIDPSQPTESVVYAYYKAALQASNDRSSRLRRGNIISDIIRR